MKKLLTLIGAIALTCNLMAVNVWDGTSEPWTNGSGTADDPYLIETASNLAYLAEKVNEGYQAQGMAVFRYTYFLMTDDFDLNNINWTPIGNINMSMEGYYFAGVFDGWYHNIDHLHIQTNADVCGLFSGLGGEWDGTMADSYGQIKHLSVTNGSVVSTGTGAAGIVGGVAGNATVVQCSYSGTVSVNNNGSYCGAGGIVAAAAENSKIEECSFSGSINATNNGGFTNAAGAGGIVGIAMNKACIQECYNTGTITATALMMSVAAGILGATLQENEVSIERCYNVGTVNAMTKGGIFGMISPINPMKDETSLTVKDCFYLNTCGGTTSYGTSQTVDQMRTEEFKNQLDQNTHAFVMDNGVNNGYPIHSLAGYKLWEAKEVTDCSAKLSADIHEGNDHFAEAKFIYYDLDNGAVNEMHFVEIEVADHVEIDIDSLMPATEYGFMISLKFDDGITWVASPQYFVTEEYDAVASSTAPEVSFYPNPATDIVHIDGVEVSEVRIYDLSGRLVKMIKNDGLIDLGNLSEGYYIISITDTGGKTRMVPVEKAY